MFCSNCGKENSNDSKFCFSCGAPLAGQARHSIYKNTSNEVLSSSGRLECPACHSINSLEEDGSEKVATSVAVYKGIGVLIYLIAIIFIGFVFFENNKIDRLFGMFGGGVLIGCGFWVIKVANSYRGYVCNSCGSSMLLDVLGDLHVTSDLGNKKNKFRNEWIAGLVVGLIVMGFVFKDSWSLPIVGGYSYEPKVVSLNGVLVTPKGEDPNGRLVQFYAVELPAPIKVNGNKSDPLNSETIYDIKVIQLTGDPAVINQIKSGKGASVNLTGTLFQSHNGHHFTSVLMSVKSVKFK